MLISNPCNRHALTYGCSFTEVLLHQCSCTKVLLHRDSCTEILLSRSSYTKVVTPKFFCTEVFISNFLHQTLAPNVFLIHFDSRQKVIHGQTTIPEQYRIFSPLRQKTHLKNVVIICII